MSKNLKFIQTVMKVLKILNKIGFVAAIVATIFCIVGGAICMYAEELFDFVIDGVTVRDMIIQESDGLITDPSIITKVASAVCFSAAIICAGSAVETKFLLGYFEKEMEDGQPFTFDGAKLLKKVALQTFICSIITVVVSAIVYALLTFSLSAGESPIEVGGISIVSPLFLYFMGVIFEYGAEQKKLNESINQ